MSGAIDLEWLALEHALKPALRIAIDPQSRIAIAARASALGAFVVAADREATIGDRARAVLYVSRDLERARALRDAEAPVLPGGPSMPPDAWVLDAHRRTGALLGYPACCADAFAARVARGVTRRDDGGEASEEWVAAEHAARRSARHDARLDVLRRREIGALVAFHPCRLDCAPAIAIADALLGKLRARDPRAADALIDALGAPIALARDGTLHPSERPPEGALVLRWSLPPTAP